MANIGKKMAFLAAGFALALAFTSSCSDFYGSVTYGGQKYRTVKIGNQTWFAENLNYAIDGSECYDDLHSNCEKYGQLYDWETAKKVCPSGWHLPNNDEWDVLFRYSEGERNENADSPYESRTAGKYLKAATGWNESGNGTDRYGFSALPGGYGPSSSLFYGIGDYGYWWSASENGSHSAYYRSLHYNNEFASWDIIDESYLRSVRCIKD